MKNQTHHHGHRKSGRFHVFRRRIPDASKWSLSRRVRLDPNGQRQSPRGRWQKFMMITTASFDAGTVILLLLTIILLFGMLLEYYHLV